MDYRQFVNNVVLFLSFLFISNCLNGQIIPVFPKTNGDVNKKILANNVMKIKAKKTETTITHIPKEVKISEDFPLYEVQQGSEFLINNAKREGVKQLASGLQYKRVIITTGIIPTVGDKVKVNYIGKLIDGREFDNSYKRSEPFIFEYGKGQVIRGLEEAIGLMPVGSKWQFFIPSYLAYGNNAVGIIPANSALIFTVELLGIEN